MRCVLRYRASSRSRQVWAFKYLIGRQLRKPLREPQFELMVMIKNSNAH